MHIPVANGDKKVFRGRREEFKVGDVQLLHLDGLTELNNEPEHQRRREGETVGFRRRQKQN